MSGQVRVHTLPLEQLSQVLRGEARLKLPHDAQLQAAIRVGPEFGLRFFSSTYGYVAEGQQIPVVTAVVLRGRL